MRHEQPFEVSQSLRKAAANASRTFVELLAALDRKRGKGGQQKVTVEHVHVHQGGQAIVGNVQGGDLVSTARESVDRSVATFRCVCVRVRPTDGTVH
jgi:hypothetical protein